MNEEPPFDEFPSDDERSVFERVECLIGAFPVGHPVRMELEEIAGRVRDQEDLVFEARQTIEKLEQVLKKVTSPANRIGTFLGAVGRETAQVVVGGSDYFCNIDPRVNLFALGRGTRVLVNEAFAIVGDLGYDTGGSITRVTEVLGADRLRVGAEHGTQSMILQRGQSLEGRPLKAGDEVRVDANFRVAIELLSSPRTREHYLDSVPDLPWGKVGGQEGAIQAIKDAIELPLLHSELFARYRHSVPKGFLLHGPPGCGKTLIGKATAYNLTAKLQEQTGERMDEYFMHIKGPEILNMWVGESERMVREIFATAREKRREGYLPFLFIDEAESILGTRRASRYSSILSTLVPMFCTEMDGIESLNEVVIILASNRADLIDPAILRPGRIDRKIRVNRPTREGAHEIYRIYLTPDLPYDPKLLEEAGSVEKAIQMLVSRTVDQQFARRDENRFLEVTLRSGRKDTLYRSDLISGAIIASIVERAKAIAIKRAIASGDEDGIREDDLRLSAIAEYEENDIFPSDDVTDDWLKLVDYDSENVVRVTPVRGESQRPPLGPVI